MAFDQESFNRDTITAFLSAYSRELVVDVLKTLLLNEHAERKAAGWKLFTGDMVDIPKNTDRMSANGKMFIRAVQMPDDASPAHDNGKKSAHTPKPEKKTDTTVRKANMLCPTCQSEMFRESICRGCKEGKAGFRVRLICGENDEHTWIV